jgi:hypothetical protein
MCLSVRIGSIASIRREGMSLLACDQLIVATRSRRLLERRVNIAQMASRFESILDELPSQASRLRFRGTASKIDR